MKKILIIVGSLRKNSFNRQLAKAVEDILAGRAELSWLDYGDLPWMNQDIEFPAPEAVARVREQVLEADGLWICSPEYNHDIPGSLKNLLDWLSRPMDARDRKSPSAAKGKPVTFSCAAGRSGAGYVRSRLKELAQTLSMEPVEGDGTGIVLDAQAFSSDMLPLSEESRQALLRQAEAFLAALDRK